MTVAAVPPLSSIRIARVEVTTASETGATHRQRQRGCDDAVGWSGANGGAVVATVAVADGHSDRRCARSRIGAEFAVAAATAMPPNIVRPGELAEALVADWRQRVDLDLADRPLTEVDAGDATDDGARAELTTAWALNARLAYGTTVALCRITRETIAIVRVGDGDVIAVTADGEAHRLAEPADRPNDVTESISGADALRVARYVEIPAGAAPVLLVLATDGFDNAYPGDESMLRAARELAELRRDSGQPIGADLLSGWAREAAGVSGDDATVAAIWIETTYANSGSDAR